MLSVKNLENFNKSTTQNIFDNQTIYESNYEHKRQMLENIRSILAIDDISLTKAVDKTKDTDELSTASSKTTTNFTGKVFAFVML